MLATFFLFSFFFCDIFDLERAGSSTDRIRRSGKSGCRDDARSKCYGSTGACEFVNASLPSSRHGYELRVHVVRVLAFFSSGQTLQPCTIRGRIPSCTRVCGNVHAHKFIFSIVTRTAYRGNPSDCLPCRE